MRGGRGQAHEADGLGDIVVNGHASAHEVGLVQEAGAAGVTEEVLPPGSVRLGDRPGEQGPSVHESLSKPTSGYELFRQITFPKSHRRESFSCFVVAISPMHTESARFS